MYQTEQQIAIEAVTLAAGLCRQVRDERVSPSTLSKSDKSPVTIADFGAQALVCRHLKTHFPNDVIVGEEDSHSLQQPQNATLLADVLKYVQMTHPNADPATVCNWIDAGNGQVADRYWTLDPIDGTKGFLRNDQYSVALALVENGELKVAALACPALPLNLDDPNSPVGVVFSAVAGQGAFMSLLGSNTPQPIHVAKQPTPAQFRFTNSVEADHGNAGMAGRIAQAININTPPLRIDSQVKYGIVARGDAVLYLRIPRDPTKPYREKIWDHAAGTLIVQEAGGIVTDINGKALDFANDYKMHHNQGVIVSNGRLHDTVLKTLRSIG